MTYDAHKNFGFTVVGVAPSTPTGGTTFSVLNANAVNLPDPASVGAYNLTVAAANQQPLSTNSEIIRITAKGAADSGGAGFTQFTISRLAENNAGGTMTARSIQVGDWIAHSITAKTLTDVETNKLDRDGSQAMTGTLTFASLTTTQQNALTPVNGMTHYNSTKALFQKYENSQWVDISKSPTTRVVTPSGSGFAADFYTTGTNDHTIINNALTAVSALGGGTVLLKIGNFTIGGTILVPTNCTLIGESRVNTVITKVAGGNFDAITNLDTINGNTNIEVKNLKVNGNNINSALGRGVNFVKSSNILVQQVYLIDAVEGFKSDTCTDLVWEKCLADGNYNWNFYQFAGTRVKVLNCQSLNAKAGAFEGFGMAFYNNCTYCEAIGNYVFNSVHNGIQLNSGGSTANVVGCIIRDNEVVSAGNYGIMVTHDTAVTYVQYLSLANNRVTGSAAKGINLINVIDSSVTGNKSWNNTTGNDGITYDTCTNIFSSGNESTGNNVGIRTLNSINVMLNDIVLSNTTNYITDPQTTILGPNDFNLYGESARNVVVNRTVIGTTGNNLTIQAGGSISGGTDNGGGALNLAGGISTGSAGSRINFKAAPDGQTSGTLDHDPSSQTIMVLSAHVTNLRGRLSIGTASAGTVDGITLGGQFAYAIQMIRETTTNTAGNQLNIQAGGATVGATDKAGGDLVLQTGLSTGTGTSKIVFQTANVGSTGTTDNSLTQRVQIDNTGLTMNSLQIHGVLDPTAAQDAATKNYVDAVAQGLSVKPSAIVATTTTLPTYTYLSSIITMTATGVVAIDGHNLALNDIVLVKNETSTNQPNNGLYTVTTAGAVGVALILTRHTSMDASTEFSGGFVFVESGTVNAAAGFVCTNTGSVTVGITNISFTQFSGAGEITAGNSLTKTGNTLDTIQDIRTSASPVFSGLTISALTLTGQGIISSNNTSALSVGPNGSTNPVLKIDGSVTGSVTGINISGNAATGGAFINVTSSGTNEKLYIDAKGSGSINVGQNSTGDINLGITATSRNVFTYGNSYIEGNSSDTLRVRYAGTGNNAFQVDAGTASAVTGVLIKGNIAASGVAFSVLSSGTDENITFDAKGAGTITLGGTSTGNIIISRTLNLGTNSLNTVGNIEVDGTAARDMTVGRAAAGNGNTLTITAGGGQSGATNASGGNLVLQSGITTGNGTSGIIFQVPRAGSSGAGDNSVSGSSAILFSTTLGQPIFAISANAITTTGLAVTQNAFAITGQANGAFEMYRQAAGNSAGHDMTIHGGGATIGATNKSAGNLIISTGISTGNAVPGLMKFEGSPLNPTSGTGDNTVIDKMILNATKVLTNNSAINLVNCTLASNTLCGGIMKYTIEVFDSTNLQMEVGEIMFACVNKGGVFSLNTMTQIGSAKQTLGSGTLTVTWAISAANPAVISLNANSSLTPATGYPRVTYTIENYTQQAIAIQ